MYTRTYRCMCFESTIWTLIDVDKYLCCVFYCPVAVVAAVLSSIIMCYCVAYYSKAVLYLTGPALDATLFGALWGTFWPWWSRGSYILHWDCRSVSASWQVQVRFDLMCISVGKCDCMCKTNHLVLAMTKYVEEHRTRWLCTIWYCEKWRKSQSPVHPIM